jgi:hypothetical protein
MGSKGLKHSFQLQLNGIQGIPYVAHGRKHARLETEIV